MTSEIENLKQDILNRYNDTWPSYSSDGVGIIQLAKDNFEEMIEKLIDLVYEAGNSHNFINV